MSSVKFNVEVDGKIYDCIREITRQDKRTYKQDISVPGYGYESDPSFYWYEDKTHSDSSLFYAKFLAVKIIERRLSNDTPI